MIPIMQILVDVVFIDAEPIAHIAVLVVNYGINNTVVLEIP